MTFGTLHFVPAIHAHYQKLFELVVKEFPWKTLIEYFCISSFHHTILR